MKRLITGFVSAVTLAVTLAASSGWTPICATFERESALWYVFLCYIDEPPGDPQGG